jgi:hypothetical protein
MNATPGGLLSRRSRAQLSAVFHATPPVTTLLTLVGYTVVFTVAAVRYFRWE